MSIRVQLHPLAYAREAQRLETMARRAYVRATDDSLPGCNAERDAAHMMREARRLKAMSEVFASPSRGT